MYAARVIGHRGAASLAPENTLAGLEAAAALGLQWVEVDLSLLGDGTVVLCHDETIDRCSDGQGALSDFHYGQLEARDAGSWFSPRFAHERIPTLQAALERLQALGLRANLELKTHGKAGEAGDAGDALVEAVARAVERRAYPPDQLLFSSFDHGALLRLKQRAPRYAVGALYATIPDDWSDFAQSVEAVSIHAHYARLTPQRVEEVAAKGLDIYAYTPNDPQHVAALWGHGLTGVFTDRPQDFID